MLWAGLGGFFGSALRYLVGLGMQSWGDRAGFPIGTLAVNVGGCLAIGVLAHLADARGLLSPQATLFVMVGLLGGFTTFSSFGNETFNLWRAGGMSAALVNAAVQIVLGIGAVWLGRFLANKLWPVLGAG